LPEQIIDLFGRFPIHRSLPLDLPNEFVHNAEFAGGFGERKPFPFVNAIFTEEMGSFAGVCRWLGTREFSTAHAES
jgi:hypothetical protein